MRIAFQVFDLVGLTELYYAGSHGMDIMSPVSSKVSDDHPDCAKSTDEQVFMVMATFSRTLQSLRTLLIGIVYYLMPFNSSFYILIL